MQAEEDHRSVQQNHSCYDEECGNCHHREHDAAESNHSNAKQFCLKKRAPRGSPVGREQHCALQQKRTAHVGIGSCVTSNAGPHGGGCGRLGEMMREQPKARKALERTSGLMPVKPRRGAPENPEHHLGEISDAHFSGGYSRQRSLLPITQW